MSNLRGCAFGVSGQATAGQQLHCTSAGCTEQQGFVHTPLSQHLCPCPAPPSTSGAFTFRWQDEAHTLGSCALKAAKGFTRSYWGEHHSAVIVPQCRLPYCTAYAQGTCKCTACQQGWLPSAGKCVSVSSLASS